MQKSNPKKPAFKKQSQEHPGLEYKMDPQPVFSNSHPGSQKLLNKNCVITGGDSGIGRATAIAFAKEGANVAIIYLKAEQKDAVLTAYLIRETYGKECLLIPTDISKENNCIKAIAKIHSHFSHIDVLVNNAGVHYPAENLLDITTEQLTETFAVNVFALFWLTKAALPHMKKGSSIINTTSVNAYNPSEVLLPYAATKGAIQNFTSNLSQILLMQGTGIRVNAVAPGPVWTPLIPSTMPNPEKFGQDTPMGRPGQPVEIAPAFVFLACDEASYIAGATIPVTGGRITI